MMRNKLFTGLAALAILTLFLGCASKDDGVKEVVFDSGDTSAPKTNDSEEVQEVTEDNTLLVTTNEESSSKIESDVPLNAKESKKNYTGWISSSIRPITNTIGNVKINTRPKKGTFSIAAVNQDGKAIPVFSTANEYTTTSFYLKAGKKLVKLCDDSGVVSAAKKTAKGLSIRYTIEKVAIVQIDFDCLASKEGYAEDTIKITACIHSLAKKKQDFALKLVMDTVLGETDRHHFYTSEGSPVKGEVLYHSMKDEKWFVSKNAKAKLQVILDGADITPVESVALANFTTLDTKKWEPDMATFRSFDTVLSYNNSAAGICWPKSALEPQEEQVQIFYLSLAADDDLPGGADYIKALTEPKDKEEDLAKPEESKKEEGQSETKVQNIQAVKENEPAKESPKAETKKEEPKKEEAKKDEAKKEEPKQEAEKEDQPQVIGPNLIADDKLSVDYIQDLLDRIANLEEGDPEVNKDEINALNAELDAILTILNSR